jgi:hypothetical protein
MTVTPPRFAIPVAAVSLAVAGLGAAGAGAGPAEAAPLPAQSAVATAGQASPSTFIGTTSLFGPGGLKRGAAVPAGATVVSLTATVPAGRSTVAGRCGPGTTVAGLGTNTTKVSDTLSVRGRSFTVVLANPGAPVAFTESVLCVDAPRATVTFARAAVVSPITFPASGVRNPPRRGQRLTAGRRLVTIRTSALRKGVGSLIGVACPGAKAGASVLLAAAHGLTVSPAGTGVNVRAPGATPKGTQTVYAICSVL